MSLPLVSVILPAYNGADTVGDAIRSVLDQEYGRWELIVVDDCSTDRTRDVVRRQSDSRVRLLEHRRNEGPDAARFTALQASSGDLVAFLDQDDLFAPGKLAAHVEYLAAHPEVGLTYNPFYLVTEPGRRTQLVSHPPAAVSLADLVSGFPLPPSTWVFRRHWALFPEIWDPATMLRGREVVLLGRLFVAGCRFAMVDQALNHRRIHLGRRYAQPALKCAEERRCQQLMLDDARCTDDARAAATAADISACLMWANAALAQGDTEEGRALLREALMADPSLGVDPPHRLAEYFLGHAAMEALDAEAQLRRVFSGACREVPGLAPLLDRTIAHAHLSLAARHVVWGRAREAEPHWACLRHMQIIPDDEALRRLAHEVLAFARAEGEARENRAVADLKAGLSALGDRSVDGRFEGLYRLARAFQAYEAGRLTSVAGDVLRGLRHDPRAVTNRGAWSILLRSAFS
jgi:glycosyltransferase involved in cell wall biosynthesis